MRKLYAKYMMIMGCAGQLLYYLQAYKIFSDKSAGDVSLAAFLFGLVSVTSWLIYGVLIKDRVLVVSNWIAVIGASAVVMGILIYG
jgi:MtN3 and saliva related transmembrane protein